MLSEQNKRIICAFTGTRADYPRIKSVLFKLKEHPCFDLKIVVTGSHLLKSSGYSIKEIKDDGFIVDAKVKMFDEILDDSLEGGVNSFNKCAKGMIKAIIKIKPDIALVTVDRVETLAIASVCALMNIPIIHVQGGEISGTIDESIRHAVTKLSHFHLTSTRLAKKRIIQMGEKPSNVFHVGCPYIDIINKIKKEAKKKPKFIPKKPYGLFIMHSVTTNLNEAKKKFDEVYKAIEKISKIILIMAFIPNTDPGCKFILNKIKKLKNIKLIKNLRSTDFLKLMQNSKVMIGNSSSGIREAASFKVPVINIGSRQRGRESSVNVVNCDFKYEDLMKTFHKVIFNETFKKQLIKCKNIYGDGRSADRIIKIIEKINLNKDILNKKFYGIKNL